MLRIKYLSECLTATYTPCCFNAYLKKKKGIHFGMPHLFMVVICSQVCDSPQRHKDKPVISLEESDLCTSSSEKEFFDTPTTSTPAETTITPAIAIISTPPHPPPTTTPPDPTTTSAAIEMVTVVYRKVVTWSWYQTFTGFIEWSHHSGSVNRGDGSLVGSRVLDTHSTVPTVTRLTEGPTTMMTTIPTTPGTTETTSSPATTTTPKLWETTTSFATEATTMSIPSLVFNKTVGVERLGKIRATRAVAVFCFWLFAGCLLLCIASAACVVATGVGLVVWYRRVYKPLSVMQARRRVGGNEGVTLLTLNRKEENEASGGGGVMALYRSVLYVHREAEEAGGKEGEGGAEGGKERVLVNLEPTKAGGGATREEEGERGGKDERGMYRKTLYRLLSKEEEIEGWRDVMEECQISAEDGGRKGVRKDAGMSGEGVSRKRYSVILREEREEAGGGRAELDWVVGGWEIKRGEGVKEEEPRSSWGEWLAHYLPSMPWGVTTPPENKATL